MDHLEVDPSEVDHLEVDPQEVVHLGVDLLAAEEEVDHLAGVVELAQLLRDESTGRELLKKL